jgi:hypothetical protein
MDWNRPGRHQSEQPAGRIVAQQRTRSRRQHRGQASAVEREVRVPYGEDTLVESMKSTSCNPLLDGGVAVAKPSKLPHRHHPVLSARESRQRLPPP